MSELLFSFTSNKNYFEQLKFHLLASKEKNKNNNCKCNIIYSENLLNNNINSLQRIINGLFF